MGRTAEATPLLERALTIQEALYESDHPNIASTSASLVSLYLMKVGITKLNRLQIAR